MTEAYKRVCVDLFSGLGGFSQAFLDRGWTVYRYDNDKQFAKVPCTHIVDVLDLTSEIIKGEHEEIDIILASPPCTCFSFAAQGKYWPRLKDRHSDVDRSVHLVRFTINLIKEIQPTYWILENPIGRLREFIGKPSAKTAWCAWGTIYKKPTYLWGVLPPIDWKMPQKWITDPSGGAGSGAIGSPYPTDKGLLALVPYNFSRAVCLAVEGESAQRILELEE